jgi:tellurite resistance protein TehA-like permease
VAATAVLGARLVLLGWDLGAIVLLVLAVLLWLFLLAPVLRAWSTPTVGVSLLLTVSTESLAALAAAVAIPLHLLWLAAAALAPLVLGLVFYAFSISRFDRRQLAVGRGDHWITGGALAISTLAAAEIAIALEAARALMGIADALQPATLVLWALSLAWLPVLIAAEARHPRLCYGLERWSSVFPVGMYAVCSFATASACGIGGIEGFARVWVWLAFATWLLVLVAALGRGARALAR